MQLGELQERVTDHTAKLAVIGLGYVGLPVACLFAQAGYDVLGIDIDEARVEKINRGHSPIEGEEPGLADLLAEVVAAKKLHAANDYAQLADCDITLIAVETPVDEHNTPRYEALRAVLQSLGPVLKPGVLVIVESTIAPGTMRNVVLPLLEEHSKGKLNDGFYLGNCPERVMPGRLLHNLRNLSRVVGGGTPQTAEVMATLYRQIVPEADLDPTDWITAEIVKTAENAYRDVQIAFANEVALICEALGGDVWKVRELVNKSPGRQMHLPGAGVGGHCIPKDPWLLAHGVHDHDVPLRLIPTARAVNDAMPLHMADLLEEELERHGKNIRGAKVLILGYAYREDTDDTRNSPSQVLLEHLTQLGAEVLVHDPFVAPYQGKVGEMAQECDALVFMVAHSVYRDVDLAALSAKMSTPILIDGRRVFARDKAEAVGFSYRGVGEANLANGL